MAKLQTLDLLALEHVPWLLWSLYGSSIACHNNLISTMNFKLFIYGPCLERQFDQVGSDKGSYRITRYLVLYLRRIPSPCMVAFKCSRRTPHARK